MNIEELRSYKEEILNIAHCHHADDIRVFGSVARGDATSKSDIDLLVHFDNKASLMDLAALDIEFSNLLGVKVDVIPDDSVDRDIKKYVFDEAIKL